MRSIFATIYPFTGRQCLCTGERDWIRAVSSQWALLRPGQCKHLHTFQSFFYVYSHLQHTQINCTCCTCQMWFSSLGTPVTATRCCRLCISADHSERKSWHTEVSLGGRRTCLPALQTSSIVLPIRREKWASFHPKSSSQGYARRMVRWQREKTLVECFFNALINSG